MKLDDVNEYRFEIAFQTDKKVLDVSSAWQRAILNDPTFKEFTTIINWVKLRWVPKTYQEEAVVAKQNGFEDRVAAQIGKNIEAVFKGFFFAAGALLAARLMGVQW